MLSGECWAEIVAPHPSPGYAPDHTGQDVDDSCRCPGAALGVTRVLMGLPQKHLSLALLLGCSLSGVEACVERQGWLLPSQLPSGAQAGYVSPRPAVSCSSSAAPLPWLTLCGMLCPPRAFHSPGSSTNVSSGHVPLPQHVHPGQEATSGPSLSKGGPDGQGLWWSHGCLPALQVTVPRGHFGCTQRGNSHRLKVQVETSAGWCPSGVRAGTNALSYLHQWHRERN